MKKRTICIRVISFLLVFVILFSLLTEVMQDKRISGEYNPTTKIRGFYAQEKNRLDFVFLGSSQVYADIAPGVLWRDFGMTSYDFTANEQPLWITYYYMKEVLKYQKPKAVVVDVFTAYMDSYMDEGVNHFSLDDMPFSMNKLKAIHASVPKELRYSYYFTLAKYHTTWMDMNAEKFTAAFRYADDPMKGYSPFVFARSYEAQAKQEILEQSGKTEIPEMSRIWIDRMIALANEENVPIVFMKTPNGNAEREMLYNSLEEYFAQQQVPFLNLNEVFDGEAHLNCLQAEKVSQYVGAYLTRHYPYEDKRGTQRYEDFERAAVLFDRYRQKCASVNADDFSGYFASVTNPEQMIVAITAKGKGSYTNEQLDTLRSLGLEAGLDETGGNYAALIYDGTVLFEQYGPDEIQFDTSCKDMAVSVGVGTDEEGETSCFMKLNGHDCSIDLNGFNVVIYDTMLDEIYELISFDAAKEYAIVRK